MTCVGCGCSVEAVILWKLPRESLQENLSICVCLPCYHPMNQTKPLLLADYKTGLLLLRVKVFTCQLRLIYSVIPLQLYWGNLYKILTMRKLKFFRLLSSRICEWKSSLDFRRTVTEILTGQSSQQFCHCQLKIKFNSVLFSKLR